jgi:hypothetical protein
MPLLLLPILARSNDDDFTKIIVGVVFVVLWGLGALISAWNKKVEQERKRRQMGRLPTGLPSGPSPAPYTPPPQPVLYPPPPPPAAARPKQKQRRRQAAFIPSPPAESQPAPVPHAVAAQPAPRAAAKSDAAPSEASKIARLVHRKDSVRAALILQEILSPPISLR